MRREEEGEKSASRFKVRRLGDGYSPSSRFFCYVRRLVSECRRSTTLGPVCCSPLELHHTRKNEVRQLGAISVLILIHLAPSPLLFGSHTVP